MRQTRHSVRLLLVAMAFLASAVLGYAQTQGSKQVDENMLRYRYVERKSRKLEFTTPRSFSERLYFYGGTGFEGMYQIGNHPENPGYAIGSRLGLGYWMTPLHGLEVTAGYSMMPYGYWSENFLGNPVIENTIIRNFSFEANYVYNIVNYVQFHDQQNTFDLWFKAGANVAVGDQFQYGLNTSLKAVYNLSSLAGVYLEPKVTLMDMQYIRPSLTAGFLFRFKTITPEFDKPLNRYKQPLFAIKSNTLYWMAGAPNISLEYPINERWSVCGDYVAPWSSSFATGQYYQLLMINAEGRYWFHREENAPVLTGFFGGFGIGGGYYDFMFGNQKTGIQGEFYIMAGLSAGYAHSISSNDRIRLEYAVGFGYLQTRYRKYHWDDFDYVLDAPREQVWKTSIFGPTQAKVSLVWMIFTNKKEVGRD